MRLRALHFCRAVVATLLLAAGGSAFAIGYNIILKDSQNVPLSCVSSAGFSFTKTVAGAFPVTSPAVVMAANCIGASTPALNLNTSNDLSAAVLESVLQKPGTGCLSKDQLANLPPGTQQPPGCQIEGLNQGPNVEGLRNSIETTVAGARYVLTFKTTGTAAPYERTWVLRQIIGAATSPTGAETVTELGVGFYHVVHDPANPIPEPGSFAMALLALALLAGAVWHRRAQAVRVRSRD